LFLKLATILLAIAVSFDGFGVGMACGVRRLAILPSSLLVICIFSSVAVAVSMLMGQTLTRYIPVKTASIAGGLILLLLGVYFIIQNIYTIYREKAEPGSEGAHDTPGSLNGFRGILDITYRPEKADVDHSGTLSAGESIILGIALGTDAFGAGFGAVMIGLNPVATVGAVGLTNFLMVSAGMLIGKKIASVGHFSRYASILAGLTLIVISVIYFI
jgi:putative sporulation protein YtaF